MSQDIIKEIEVGKTSTKHYQYMILAIEKGYSIDKDGFVFSKDRKLKLSKNSSGYYFFTVWTGKLSAAVRVHCFQAFSKYGDEYAKSNLIVRHKDGNKLNNSIDNILIGTYKDNADDITVEAKKIRAKKIRDNMSPLEKERRRKIMSETAKRMWRDNREVMLKPLIGVTRVCGETHGCAKLTEKDVRQIRSLYPTKKHAEIAKMFGISESHCEQITSRRSWKHLK